MIVIGSHLCIVSKLGRLEQLLSWARGNKWSYSFNAQMAEAIFLVEFLKWIDHERCLFAV